MRTPDAIAADLISLADYVHATLKGEAAAMMAEAEATPKEVGDQPTEKTRASVERDILEACKRGGVTIADNLLPIVVGVAISQRNAGYYRGRHAQRKSERSKNERFEEELLARINHWRERARSAEGQIAAPPPQPSAACPVCSQTIDVENDEWRYADAGTKAHALCVRGEDEDEEPSSSALAASAVTEAMVEAATHAGLAVDVGPGNPDECCSIKDYPYQIPATCYLNFDQMRKVMRAGIEAALAA